MMSDELQAAREVDQAGLVGRDGGRAARRYFLVFRIIFEKRTESWRALSIAAVSARLASLTTLADSYIGYSSQNRILGAGRRGLVDHFLVASNTEYARSSMVILPPPPGRCISQYSATPGLSIPCLLQNCFSPERRHQLQASMKKEPGCENIHIPVFDRSLSIIVVTSC